MTYLLDSAIKKPKILVTNHSSSQASANNSGSSNKIVISGSEITYNPEINSSKVIYEIGFYAEKKDGNSFQFLRLEYYSTSGKASGWTEYANGYARNIGSVSNLGNQNFRYYVHVRLILSAWSGDKQLRLTMGSPGYSTFDFDNENIELNQLTNWEGSTVTDKFCNTNLLVYSI